MKRKSKGRRKSAGRRKSKGRVRFHPSIGLGGLTAKAESLKNNLKKLLRKKSNGGGDTYRITEAINQVEAAEQSLKLAKVGQ